MSHFTVLVIGSNPEQQLAPYQENNMGDCPKEFMKFKVWDTNGKDHWFDSEEDFKKSGIEVDEDERGYWENPNNKWDWYTLGGRWTGFFKSKLGVLSAVVGQPGIMTEEAREGYADQLLKSDIDFEYMRNEAENKALQEYDFATSIFGDMPVNETWEDVRNRIEGIDNARAYYWSQPRCIAWKQKQSEDYRNFPFGYISSPDEFIISKETYLQNARNSAGLPFAIVKDSKWYERGKMGWFAFVGDEKDENEWNKEASKLIDELPDDTLLSVYDCHI